jgi:hypothetical protein
MDRRTGSVVVPFSLTRIRVTFIEPPPGGMIELQHQLVGTVVAMRARADGADADVAAFAGPQHSPSRLRATSRGALQGHRRRRAQRAGPVQRRRRVASGTAFQLSSHPSPKREKPWSANARDAHVVGSADSPTSPDHCRAGAPGVLSASAIQIASHCDRDTTIYHILHYQTAEYLRYDYSADEQRVAQREGRYEDDLKKHARSDHGIRGKHPDSSCTGRYLDI